MRSGTGIAEFNKWFREYCDDNEFRSIDILKFRDDLKQKFGFDFYPYLDNWYNGKDQPGFIISGLQVNEIIIDERSRYQVSFTASNPEMVTGIFNISFRGEGAGGLGRQRGGMGGFQPDGTRPGQGPMQGRGMDASDIEKIVLLEPNETKKISLITEVRPRAVILNTLFSRNIPGEINLPVNDIIKSKRNKTTEEEKIVIPAEQKILKEIIVDNEDNGFSSGAEIIEAPLKRILGITNRRSKTYLQISEWNIPEYWQPVVSTNYYGKYVRSAVYTRAETGTRELTWKTGITTPGYYDIYCYSDKSYTRMSVRADGRGGMPGPGGPDNQQGGPDREREGEARFRDFHYKVYHDGGVEEITFDYQNAEPGWNSLGRFYISSDSAKVTLSNQSSGKLVIGDAIKWVRVE
jgi:hypothetical protein